MQPNEYQDLTKETEIYSESAYNFAISLVNRIEYEGIQPNDDFHEFVWLQLAYCTGKLNGEAGEAAEIVFKAFRGDLGVLSDQQKILLAKEMGDVLWYVARISALIGYRLEDIMEMNIGKLMDRKDRNQLHGYGDLR